MARLTGGIERTTWDDTFSAAGLRNRQMRDLVIPLTAILLAAHLIEIAGRRLLLFAAARDWMRAVKLPRPRLRWRPTPAPEPIDAGGDRTLAPPPPPVIPPKPVTSPLARAKAKARGRVKSRSDN
jgi:hypothetical protein